MNYELINNSAPQVYILNLPKFSEKTTRQREKFFELSLSPHLIATGFRLDIFFDQQ